jgi:uncharacterized membrane protein
MNPWIMAHWAGLAQFPETASAGKYSVGDVLMWGAILIGIVFVGSLFIMLLRRRLKDPALSTGADAGFSLSDLREMRDRGEITIEEYEQTRARVIAKVKALAKEHPKGGQKPPEETDSGG